MDFGFAQTGAWTAALIMCNRNEKNVTEMHLSPRLYITTSRMLGRRLCTGKKKKKAKNISIWRRQIVTGYVTDSY